MVQLANNVYLCHCRYSAVHTANMVCIELCTVPHQCAHTINTELCTVPLQCAHTINTELCTVPHQSGHILNFCIT